MIYPPGIHIANVEARLETQRGDGQCCGFALSPYETKRIRRMLCGTITDSISGLVNDICGGVWFEYNLPLESLFVHEHPESQNSKFSWSERTDRQRQISPAEQFQNVLS